MALVRKGRNTAKRTKKKSWEAQELKDIYDYWKPGWRSKEGKRKLGLRKS